MGVGKGRLGQNSFRRAQLDGEKQLITEAGYFGLIRAVETLDLGLNIRHGQWKLKKPLAQRPFAVRQRALEPFLRKSGELPQYGNSLI